MSWKKQLVSTVNVMKLVFYGEQTIWMCRTISPLRWGNWQLKSLARRLQKDEALKKRYQDTIDADVSAVYVGKLDQTELNKTQDKLQWYLQQHHVINPHKPEKVRLVRNTLAKYQSVAINVKLVFGPGLILSFIGTFSDSENNTICRYRSNVSSSCCSRRRQ